jgi:hypothetical protein
MILTCRNIAHVFSAIDWMDHVDVSYLPQLASPLRRSKAEGIMGNPIYECLGPTSLIHPNFYIIRGETEEAP